MGYYVRLLAENDKSITLNEIEKYLKFNKVKAYLEIEDGDTKIWNQVVIKIAKMKLSL